MTLDATTNLIRAELAQKDATITELRNMLEATIESYQTQVEASNKLAAEANRIHEHWLRRYWATVRKLNRVRVAAKEYMAGKLTNQALGMDRLSERIRELEEDLMAQTEYTRQVADRLAAASEALSNRAERFEKAAYLEGWHIGNWNRFGARTTVDQEIAERSWEQSESAKRLAGGGK